MLGLLEYQDRRHSEKLINVSTQQGLQQLERETTKHDSSLDLFFTSNMPLMPSIDTVPGISTYTAHEAIVVDLNLKAEIAKSVLHRVYLEQCKVGFHQLCHQCVCVNSALRPVVGQ